MDVKSRVDKSIDWVMDIAIAERNQRVNEQITNAWRTRYIDGVLSLMIGACLEDQTRYAREIREVLGAIP